MIAPIYDIAAWWQLRRTVEKDGINEKNAECGRLVRLLSDFLVKKPKNKRVPPAKKGYVIPDALRYRQNA